MADVDYEIPVGDPGPDPEADGVRRSGRKIKAATFADGTAVNTFIKSEFDHLVTLRSGVKIINIVQGTPGGDPGTRGTPGNAPR